AAKKPAIAKKPAAKPVAKAAKAPAPRKVAPKKPAPPKAAAKKPAAPKRLVKKIIEKPAAPKRPVKKTVEKPVPKKAMAAKAPRKPPIKAAPPVQPEAKPAEETVVEGVEVTTDKAGLMTSGIYGGVVVCESPGRLPKRSPYSQRERERLHKQLMQERERVTESLARLEQAGIAAGSYSDEHKVPGYSNDPTEFASDYQAADTSLGLRALEETRRQQVEEAMTRMRDGLYGVCVACGSKIGYQRLMAKPFAVLCISCMENYEKRRPR
ncbi:MAG: TraR/DksA C4-type zinc finger protein, partial [Candidatus Sumerlaeota bacterium]|nr:TraR/DksA C4-type zinc finger protein [Candidatus Sumerlaeota bacterium]